MRNRHESATVTRAHDLFMSGVSVDKIASTLCITANTIWSWKRRYRWHVGDSEGRINAAFAARIETLVRLDLKTENDWDELERLQKMAGEFMARARPAAPQTGESRQRNIPTLAEVLPPPPSLDNPPKPEKEKRGKGRPKANEKNVLTQDQVAELKEAFFSSIFPYQKGWHEAKKHDGRIILKSRQIGATYYFALEALITALTEGRNQIFISASKKQANQFRRYIQKFIMQHCDIELKGDPIRIKVEDSAFGEVFLFFLGTQVSSVQGYSGDLYLDECGWVRGFSEIQEVASAMALQAKYKETYFTTPSSMEHPFYQFWTGDSFNKDRPKDQQISIDVSHASLKDGGVAGDGFWRQIVTLEDAIENGCTLFDLEKVKRKYSPARYAMLCMCQFTDNETGVFKFSLLQQALVDAVGYWPNYTPEAERIIGDAECWLGYDPAGEGEDKAAIVVVALPKEKGDKYKVVWCQRLVDADYLEQAATVENLASRFNIKYMGIDNQGIGDGVFQLLRNKFHFAEGIRYSPETKSAMVVKASTLFSRGLIEVDNAFTDDFIPAMLAIQRSVTAGGIPTYSAKRTNATGHADVAWAFLHAISNGDFENITDETRETDPRLKTEFF